MTKLLVSCDQYAYKYEEKFYLKEFGFQLVNRYLDIFNHVSFLVRSKEVFSESELGIHNIPITDDRIKIIPLPFFQGPKEYLKVYLKLNKAIRSSVDGHDAAIYRIPSTVAFKSMQIANRKKIPYAVEVVANPLESLKNSGSVLKKLLMLLVHQQQKRACRNAYGVSYVTKSNLQNIYPAIKEGHFESFYSSVELPNSFFYTPRRYPSDKPFSICHVSNHIKSLDKGHLTVIQIVKMLSDKGFYVTVKFAGEGNMIPLLKEKAAELDVLDRIEFVGFLKHHKLREFLISSDLMLFPSKSEGLPRVLIEAMATGLPCLSSPVGGISELLTNDFLCHYTDVSCFTDKVIRFINDPEFYEKQSEINFNRAKKYTVQELQPKRAEFYKRLHETIYL
jgi:glycosyltransferase involved in cell wall biosynthesis